VHRITLSVTHHMLNHSLAILVSLSSDHFQALFSSRLMIFKFFETFPIVFHINLGCRDNILALIVVRVLFTVVVEMQP